MKYLSPLRNSPVELQSEVIFKKLYTLAVLHQNISLMHRKYKRTNTHGKSISCMLDLGTSLYLLLVGRTAEKEDKAVCY